MIFIIYYILIIVFGIHGLPMKQAKKDVNCLILSPEIQDQINDITDKIADFITDVSKKYDNIDLRLVNMNIDRHSAIETNKTTVFRVNINDCSTKNTYRKYKTNNVKNINNNNNTKDARKETDNDIKRIEDDSIDFDDLDADEKDFKIQAVTDEYFFVGDNQFISDDKDNEYVMNYDNNENNNNITEEDNYVKSIYYFNFNDLKNNNVTCENVINVFE